jgi:hypothetical protein
MKTKLSINSSKTVLAIIALFVTLSLSAQPSYYFTNFSRVSGADKQIGTIYRFTSVKSGVDALVTIDTLTGGLTIDSMDVKSLGFDAAFQPQIHIGAHSSGYAQFNIQFVIAGTSIPSPQINVPITAIDIDGHINVGDTLAEYDEMNLGLTGTLLNLVTTTQLSVTTAGSWITGKNIGGVEFTGVDTLAKDGMFTVVNPLTTSFKVRTGVDNRSGNTPSRNSSIYFQKFTYPATILALSDIKSFTGEDKDNTVKLEWSVEAHNTLQSITLEKSVNGTDYNETAQYWINADTAVNQTEFNYTDASVQSVVYYRLKVVSDGGKTEYTNVLSFRNAASETNTFRVYPTVISSTATVNVSADKTSTASFQLVDYSGRTVYLKQVQLADGSNNFSVSNFGMLPAGNYIAVMRTSGKIYNQKVIIK